MPQTKTRKKTPSKTQNKTQPTDASVAAFLERIADEGRRHDCLTLVQMMKRVTRAEPRMWGPSMVGFGQYHYKYESGREGDLFRIGFAPRKQDLTLYIMGGSERYAAILARLGKHKGARSCLYIKRLDDVDRAVLEELIAAAWKYRKLTHG